MGTKVWTGDAAAVAQIDWAKITAFDYDTNYEIVINGLTVGVGGIDDEATTVKSLVVAINTSALPEFQEIAASAANDTIILTAKTAGVPFTATSNAGGTGSGTFGAVTNSTPSSGPNDWSTAMNWNGGAVPVNADVVYITRSSSSILYGLAQSAVDLDELHVTSTFTGRIGLPRINATGGYIEYRNTGLTIGAAAATIDGTNAQQINLDLGTDQTAATINGSGKADTTAAPPMLITGTNASNVINVNRGEVGIGFLAEGAATVFPTVNDKYITNQASEAIVTVGSTASTTTVTQNGGTLLLESPVTTLVIHAGVCTLTGGVGGITTITIYDGILYHNTAATTTTLIMVGGVTDLRQTTLLREITNASMYAGAEMYNPLALVQWIGGIDLIECSELEVTIDNGKNLPWMVTAI